MSLTTISDKQTKNSKLRHNEYAMQKSLKQLLLKRKRPELARARLW